MVVIEDFEDGDVAGWQGTTTRLSATDFQNIDGAFSARFFPDSQASVYLDIASYGAGEFSFLFEPRYSAQSGEFTITYEDGGVTRNYLTVRYNDNASLYVNGDFKSGSLAEFATIKVRAYNVDTGAKTYDLEILENGSTFYSESDVSWENTGSFDSFSQFNCQMTPDGSSGSVIFDTLTTTPIPPGTPTNLTASPSADDISLSWDDVSAENGYYVYRAQVSGSTTGDYTQIDSIGADATSYTDAALEDGERYYYRVSAFNSSGESSLSNEAAATTALPAPSGPSVTVTADDDISVSWTDSSDNEDQFRVEVSEDGGSYALVGTVSANTTSIGHTPARSVNTVQYRVRAETEHVNSAWATTATVATNAAGLAVANHDATSISLTWTGADQPDGYEVVRAQASGSTAADYTSIATVGSSTTSYQDTSLENGERYYYRVRVLYDGGSNSPLTAEVVQTTDLPAPSAVSLDTSVEDEISLSWTLNDNSTDGAVEVYRSTDGTLGTEITGGLTPDATSYTDTAVVDGEQYYYTIRRTTGHAESDSSQQSGVTVLPAPTNLTVDAVTDTTVDLSWTDNHDNGQTRVEFKPASTSTWQTFATLAIGAGSETITGLRNGEQYDARVVATTEHADTEDT